MKKLSLFLFLFLILGCGTETPVVEEPEPVIEESPPVVIEDEPVAAPQIVGGNVLDGEVDADPELLNSTFTPLVVSHCTHHFSLQLLQH